MLLTCTFLIDQLHVLRRGEVGVPDDRDVHAGDGSGRQPAHVNDLGDVVLGDLHSISRNKLLPANHHVAPEDDDAGGVEGGLAEVLEELDLSSVQVSDAHEGDALVGFEEDTALHDAVPGHVGGRRSELGVGHLRGEPEIPQVHGEEKEDDQTRQEHVPPAGVEAVVDADFPRSLESDEDVEKQGEGQVELNRRQTDRTLLPDAEASSPGQSVEEIALAVGLVGALDHADEVAQNVDNGESQEEAGRSDGALTVRVNLEVASEEDSPEQHQDNVLDQEDDGTKDTAAASITIRRGGSVVDRTSRGSRRTSSGNRTHVDSTVWTGRVHVLFDRAWFVDAVPLVSGILACIGHNCGNTTRVHLGPLGDIVGPTGNDDPDIALRVMLAHFFHREATVATGLAATTTAAATADLADEPRALSALLNQVLLEGVGLVDSVPLF
mmetsp:Transcript_75913/g.158309  ORF Transcript_75913/g.158309 Transcript_75913/m.158309 type:complete len:438 (+) Transcript_75913:428-1741(+)